MTGLPGQRQVRSGETMIRFSVNGHEREFAGDENMPLLWVVRDIFGLTGTKFGCGAGLCGACTVHIDGRAQRSCVVAAKAAHGRSITTIEGLADRSMHAVQRAWIEYDVPQCGYCQAGQIMAVVDLLERNPQPTDAEIDASHTNICRCGTYARMRKAIHRAAEIMSEEA